MANPEHVKIITQGADAIAAWRKMHPKWRLDLRAAHLVGAQLQCVNLQRADLQGAQLQGANLQRANLEGTNLQRANLEGAQLQRVNLQRANLEGAQLQIANLEGAALWYANLNNANFENAYLDGADLTTAYFNRQTQFDGISISGETKGLGPWVFNPEKYVIREIEFPPEYHQAGVGIMNYFSTVLRQKYPDIPATIQITQEELTVRLTIETDNGHREIIEQTLEEYGLVVSGHRQPSELLPDAVDVFRLENQLSLTRVQLESERRALQLTEQQYSRRIESLEEEVAHLRQLVGDQLRHADRLVDVLELQAFAPLRPLLDRGLTEADEAEVKRLLTEAGQHNPGMLQRLAEAIAAGTIGGAGGTLLAEWLKQVARDIGVVITLAF